MEIKSITRNGYVAELIIITGNTESKEDLCEYSKDKGWHVDETLIEQLITVAFDFSRFNKNSDAETVKMIIDAFLSKSEKTNLIEELNEQVSS